MNLEDKISKLEALSIELVDRQAPLQGNDLIEFERAVYMKKFAIKLREDAQTLEMHLKELKGSYKIYQRSNIFRRLLGKPDYLNVKKTSTNALINMQRLFENLNHFIQTVYDPEVAFKANEEVNKTGRIIHNYKIKNILRLRDFENIPPIRKGKKKNINLVDYFYQKFQEREPSRSIYR